MTIDRISYITVSKRAPCVAAEAEGFDSTGDVCLDSVYPLPAMILDNSSKYDSCNFCPCNYSRYLRRILIIGYK